MRNIASHSIKEIGSARWVVEASPPSPPPVLQPLTPPLPQPPSPPLLPTTYQNRHYDPNNLSTTITTITPLPSLTSPTIIHHTHHRHHRNLAKPPLSRGREGGMTGVVQRPSENPQRGQWSLAVLTQRSGGFRVCLPQLDQFL